MMCKKVNGSVLLKARRMYKISGPSLIQIGSEVAFCWPSRLALLLSLLLLSLLPLLGRLDNVA